MEPNETFMEEDDPSGDRILQKYQSLYETQVVPQNVWEWQIFGNSELVFAVPFHINWWKRLWCRIFFGSRFKKIR